MKKEIILATVCFLGIAAVVFSYLDIMNKKAFASIPQRNDIVAEAASNRLPWETAYLMSQEPIDPDGYIYAGDCVVKAR